MGKKKLKLEFNYRVRNYVEPKNGVDCYEVSFEPVGDMTDIFKKELPSLRSIASCSLENTLSLAAMTFQESATYRLEEGAEFEDTAYFTNPEGETMEVTPATFTPHNGG